MNAAPPSITKLLSERPGPFVDNILGSLSFLVPFSSSFLYATPELFHLHLLLSVGEQLP